MEKPLFMEPRPWSASRDKLRTSLTTVGGPVQINSQTDFDSFQWLAVHFDF